MAIFSSAPNSICIMRLSAIGDVCNTIAAVQAIQRQWPSTKITWITGKLEAQLIYDLEGVEVVVFDKKQGLNAYYSLWKTLKGKQFDALLHMQYAIRSSIATLGIRAKHKLGFDIKRSQDFQILFTNVKVPSPPKPHVLDGLLAFCSTLGIQDITPHWSLTYSMDERQWANEQLSRKQKNLILVPAASKQYKNWTTKGYIDVIQHAHNLGWNIILAGSPAKVEIELAKTIEVNLSIPVTNLVGKSSIKELLSLIDNADLLISPDTGPAHMANAMNTPVIGLYAHHNPLRTGPYRYLDYVVSVYNEAIFKETGKQPDRLEWRTRVKDEHVMSQISSRDVIVMFDKIVNDFY